MVLSARVCVYMSIFAFNRLTFCKNAVENETAGGVLRAANETVQAPCSVSRFPSVTRDLSFGESAANGVEKRSVGGADGVTSNATTAKPKAKKTSTATAKWPPQRASATKPPPPMTTTRAEPKTAVRNSTAWPKPDKRVASSGRAKTAAANRTDDDGDPVVTDFMNKYPISLWKDHGFYTDDYADLINRHWFKYAPPNQSSHYVLAILYTVITVFGCFGNSLVIFMYIK